MGMRDGTVSCHLAFIMSRTNITDSFPFLPMGGAPGKDVVATGGSARPTLLSPMTWFQTVYTNG